MKILLISQYFFPERFVINEVAQELVRRGHEVTVLTGLPNYPSGRLFDGYRPRPLQREVVGAVTVIRVPVVPRMQARSFQLVLNYLSFAASGVLATAAGIGRGHDTVLVYLPSPITSALPAIVLRAFYRVPVVLWLQDLWPESLRATGAIRSRLALRLADRLVRWIYGKVDRILVQSPGFENSVRARAPMDVEIRYVPNPADSHYQPVSRSEQTPTDFQLFQGFRILFAGNMGVAQDLHNVLAAAKLTSGIQDLKWILIGAGREKASLSRKIEELGLRDTVQIAGPYDPSEMPTLFGVSDVLLVSLRNDEALNVTIPSKMQAYLASARPILAAVGGPAADILRAAGAGLACDPGDPAALATAALAMYRTEPECLEEMGQRGRAYYEREFASEVVLSRLEASLLAAKLSRTSRRSGA
jgi:colanic acid biosynthesis glycosyl transferase WcaI